MKKICILTILAAAMLLFAATKTTDATKIITGATITPALLKTSETFILGTIETSTQTVTGTITATAFSGSIDGCTGYSDEIETVIDAYGNNSAEVNLIWTAFSYQSLGPAEKVDSDGSVNAGYAVTNGTAIIGLDTWEVLDNLVRTSINATSEIKSPALSSLTDLYNTSEVYLLLSYDSGFALTLGDSVEIGVASAEVMAIPAGDSPILLIYLQNDTCEAFDWGTDNWDKEGVTATVYPIAWPNSGSSVYSQ